VRLLAGVRRRGALGSPLGLDEGVGVQVVERLLDLLASVHHERPVAGMYSRSDAFE